MLEGLRSVINDHMVQLLEARVGKLHLVGVEIEATLGAGRDDITDGQNCLWNEEMLEMDISNGANVFKQGILTRMYGRNNAVSRVGTGYQTWRHLIDEATTFIEQLKRQRWDDDLEDIEDNVTIESRNTLLTREDPQLLQDHLNTSLEKAFSDLHEKISVLLATYKDSENIGQISIYMLRILRSIRSEIPKHKSLQVFGLELVPSLHKKLISTVTAPSTEVFSKYIIKKRVAGRALWEGTPELPVQPSPGTFKFLHGLTMAMGDAGADLWSPSAVGVLKRHLRSELGRRWMNALNEQEAQKPSQISVDPRKEEADAGDATNEPQNTNVRAVDHATQNEVLIQSLFDILVLQSSLELSSAITDDELQELAESVESKLDLEPSSKKRLQQGAKEYWRRTGLLFGLLA